MSAKTFKCRKCEATVKSSSGNALMVCASCGELYSSQNIADLPVSLILSHSSDEIAEVVKRQLSDSRHMRGASISIESVEGVYVPIFITRTTIQGTWKGYHSSPNYTSGEGAESIPNADKVWDFGSIDEATDYPLIASTSGTDFGMELIHRTLFDQQPVGLSDIDWNAVESPLLAIDIDTSRVNQLVKEHIIQDAQNRVLEESKATIMGEFDVEVDYHNRCIVYVPFWTVQYRHKQKIYRAAVSGGDGKVLGLTEPVLFASKLGLWVQSITSLAGAGFIAETSLPVVIERWEWDALESVHSLANGEGLVQMLLLLVILCWYMLLSAAKKMPGDMRIKRLGEAEELVVISQVHSTLHRPEILMAAITVILTLGFRIYGTIGILAPLLILFMGLTTIRRIVSSASQLQTTGEEYLQNPKRVLMTYGQLAVENRQELSNRFAAE